MTFDTLYLLVTGAGTARRLPGLLPRLLALVPRVMTVLTPNAERVVSPRELALVPGHRVVESYFDPAITPFPPPGIVLVCPCTFGSLNKLAGGIADNLPLSIAAEAIGRGTPVIVAVSVNPPLWAHPRTRLSVSTLRSWGCTVLDPVPNGDWLTLAPDDVIVDAVSGALRAGEGEGAAGDRAALA